MLRWCFAFLTCIISCQICQTKTRTQSRVMAMRTGSYSFVPLEKIIWGVPAVEALPREIEERRAARVFIVASGTLSRKTQVIDQIAHALAERYVGRFDECREHAPLESVIECLSAARRASPDLLVTIGGGTVIDTAKIVQLGLTHEVST